MLEDVNTLKELSLGSLIIFAMVYIIKIILNTVSYVADSRTTIFTALLTIIEKLSTRNKNDM